MFWFLFITIVFAHKEFLCILIEIITKILINYTIKLPLFNAKEFVFVCNKRTCWTIDSVISVLINLWFIKNFLIFFNDRSFTRVWGGTSIKGSLISFKFCINQDFFLILSNKWIINITLLLRLRLLINKWVWSHSMRAWRNTPKFLCIIFEFKAIWVYFLFPI
jgi:hypothetical protein